jgi:MFS family permease
MLNFTAVVTLLEYFDFISFSLLYKFIPFANHSILQIGVGYMGRFIGSIFIAYFSRQYGQKNILKVSIWSMTIATLLIGILPCTSYSLPLLYILRLIQGFSFASEFPTGAMLVKDKSPMVISGATLGYIFASLLFFLLTTQLNTNQMNNFGWRIPFWIGGIIGLFIALKRGDNFERSLFQLQLPKLQIRLSKFHVRLFNHFKPLIDKILGIRFGWIYILGAYCLTWSMQELCFISDCILLLLPGILSDLIAIACVLLLIYRQWPFLKPLFKLHIILSAYSVYRCTFGMVGTSLCPQYATGARLYATVVGLSVIIIPILIFNITLSLTKIYNNLKSLLKLRIFLPAWILCICIYFMFTSSEVGCEGAGTGLALSIFILLSALILIFNIIVCLTKINERINNSNVYNKLVCILLCLTPIYRVLILSIIGIMSITNPGNLWFKLIVWTVILLSFVSLVWGYISATKLKRNKFIIPRLNDIIINHVMFTVVLWAMKRIWDLEDTKFGLVIIMCILIVVVYFLILDLYKTNKDEPTWRLFLLKILPFQIFYRVIDMVIVNWNSVRLLVSDDYSLPLVARLVVLLGFVSILFLGKQSESANQDTPKWKIVLGNLLNANDTQQNKPMWYDVLGNLINIGIFVFFLHSALFSGMRQTRFISTQPLYGNWHIFSLLISAFISFISVPKPGIVLCILFFQVILGLMIRYTYPPLTLLNITNFNNASILFNQVLTTTHMILALRYMNNVFKKIPYLAPVFYNLIALLTSMRK